MIDIKRAFDHGPGSHLADVGEQYDKEAGYLHYVSLHTFRQEHTRPVLLRVTIHVSRDATPNTAAVELFTQTAGWVDLWSLPDEDVVMPYSYCMTEYEWEKVYAIRKAILHIAAHIVIAGQLGRE